MTNYLKSAKSTSLSKKQNLSDFLRTRRTPGEIGKPKRSRVKTKMQKQSRINNRKNK